jgi:hypothetical protein
MERGDSRTTPFGVRGCVGSEKGSQEPTTS